MTCKECIHKEVCYRRNYVTSDFANKCGFYFSDSVIDDIKTEIENIEINGYIRDVECFNAGINTALKVIDKHTRKE